MGISKNIQVIIINLINPLIIISIIIILIIIIIIFLLLLIIVLIIIIITLLIIITKFCCYSRAHVLSGSVGKRFPIQRRGEVEGGVLSVSKATNAY